MPVLRREYSYGIIRGGPQGADIAWWDDGFKQLLEDLSAVQQGKRRPYCEGVLCAVGISKVFKRIRKEVSVSKT